MNQPSQQQEIMRLVNGAAKEILVAHSLAIRANPMAESLPVFQRLLSLQRELGECIQQIGKVRGL